ncbi:hypothetical protein [Pseudomarimonas salicorniae]|uniref:Uncharacterized protein n=1 Tax=Pseudomarimonas salicorniae TaxID=2933270 RepID=A0ABT0GJB3_9GAMM|nr:hypothetical protein [Lysobacter sp. CAU 1642]MCK7594634.1 hypothetical protein [Lysobacter sp. CAU 1642]
MAGTLIALTLAAALVLLTALPMMRAPQPRRLAVLSSNVLVALGLVLHRLGFGGGDPLPGIDVLLNAVASHAGKIRGGLLAGSFGIPARCEAILRGVLPGIRVHSGCRGHLERWQCTLAPRRPGMARQAACDPERAFGDVYFGREEDIHRVRLAAPGVPSERPYLCAQGAPYGASPTPNQARL